MQIRERKYTWIFLDRLSKVWYCICKDQVCSRKVQHLLYLDIRKWFILMSCWISMHLIVNLVLFLVIISGRVCELMVFTYDGVCRLAIYLANLLNNFSWEKGFIGYLVGYLVIVFLIWCSYGLHMNTTSRNRSFI